MKTKTEKRQKKEKKKRKISVGRAFENNLFAIKLMAKTAPIFTFTYFGWSIVGAVLNFFTSTYLFRMIINSLSLGEPKEHILAYILCIGSFNLAFNCFTMWLVRFVYPRQDQKIAEKLEAMLYEKAAQVELACYETPEFYDKYVRATDVGVDRMYDVIYTLDRLIWKTTALFTNSVMLFIIDPWLIVFGLVPLLLGFVKRADNKLKHDCDTEIKPLNRKKKYVQRCFYLTDYAKEMRLTEMYKQLYREWDESFKQYKKTYQKYGFKRAAIGFAQKIGMEVVVILGSTFYAVYNTVVRSAMLPGDCLVVINSISEISSNLNSFVSTLAEFDEHALYLEDVRFFLAYEPKIRSRENAPAAKGDDISLENVSFSYVGSEAKALDDVSFTIKKGERIALVGANGSGKTTLVKLLLRLYDPTEGKVCLDGVDVRDFEVESYRRLFGTVFQDYKNFSMSVKQNILMKQSFTEEDEAAVIEALKQSGAYDKVMSLPKGIDTILTREFDQDGAVLSGGESQKISLARVFAGKRQIVILDEPSSALDPIAEYNMFENMMRATEGKTVIFISHRLSAATLADRVLLMDGGKLIESGTHDELMARGGKYAEMFEKQAQNYLAEEELA